MRTNYKYDPSYLDDKVDILNPFPRLHLLENQSSDSYDLLIMNTTDFDEGLYYCGTEQKEIHTTLSQKYIYKYGNITTRILLSKCLNLISVWNSLSWVKFIQRIESEYSE